MENVAATELEAHRQVLTSVIDHLQPAIEQAGRMAVNAIDRGNKIILFGNGGSAADAQHLASELTGRYKRERRPLPAIALTTDTSALTAVGNDYAFEQVFERQVQAVAAPGDLLIGISTSGNSANVVRGIEAGRAIGCTTLGLTGNGGGKLGAVTELNVVVPSDDTARIQEMHILIGHAICQMIDDQCAVERGS